MNVPNDMNVKPGVEKLLISQILNPVYTCRTARISTLLVLPHDKQTNKLYIQGVESKHKV